MALTTGPTRDMKLAASAAPPGPASGIAGSCGVKETSRKPAASRMRCTRAASPHENWPGSSGLGGVKGGKFFYIPSLSYKTLVYKGMLTTAQRRVPDQIGLMLLGTADLELHRCRTSLDAAAAAIDFSVSRMALWTRNWNSCSKVFCVSSRARSRVSCTRRSSSAARAGDNASSTRSKA